MKVMKVEYVSFTWRLPMAMYSVNEGTTKKIFIEIMKGVQLPEEYTVHAKVLPSGKQFSLLCGVTRYMYEEVYMQRRMGNHHNTNSAIFQAFDRFVIQPVLLSFLRTPPSSREVLRSSSLMRSALRVQCHTSLAMQRPKELPRSTINTASTNPR
jgi:hypothetical protein